MCYLFNHPFHLSIISSHSSFNIFSFIQYKADIEESLLGFVSGYLSGGNYQQLDWVLFLQLFHSKVVYRKSGKVAANESWDRFWKRCVDILPDKKNDLVLLKHIQIDVRMMAINSLLRQFKVPIL